MNVLEPTILLVEDSNEDYMVISRIISKLGNPVLLHRVDTAEDALAFLMPEKINQHYNLPSIILLDLNMPGMGGRELLRCLKTHEQFKFLPIIVMTASSNPRDIQECYCLGANSYHIKPVNYEKFSDSIQAIISYWFTAATYPKLNGINK